MNIASGECALGMIDPVMPIARINKAIVPSPAIAGEDPSRIDLPSNTALLEWLFCNLERLPRKPDPHARRGRRRLSCQLRPFLAFLPPPGSRQAFIPFNNTEHRALRLASCMEALAQCPIDPVDSIAIKAAGFGCL